MGELALNGSHILEDRPGLLTNDRRIGTSPTRNRNTRIRYQVSD